MGASSFMGIEIGGTKLQLVRGDASLRIVRRWRANVDRAAGAAGIQRQIQAGIKDLLADGPAHAIGVGFGGPINWRTGAIGCSHHIEGWNGFPLTQWLTETTGLPAIADNDANVATLGEACAGAGVGLSPVFYATLGSGVGGGLVVDGNIYHGIAPGEVEFGHVRLSPASDTVESRCAGWAVDRRIRALASENPGSALAQMIGQTPGGEARHLVTALNEHDALARHVLDELSTDLAFALSHVIHLFHPAILVLGGLSLAGEPLRSAVAAKLPNYVMEAFHPPPPLSLTRLGEDPVPIGALKLASSLNH